MAQIWKNRARKPIAAGRIDSTGYHPHGIGGVLLNMPCISLSIEDHRVIIPVNEFTDCLKSLKRIDPAIFGLIVNAALHSKD